MAVRHRRYTGIRESQLAAVMNPIAPQKEEVREFWNADPCGTRYLEGKEDFDAHARDMHWSHTSSTSRSSRAHVG